jgi:hypothetical protein
LKPTVNCEFLLAGFISVIGSKQNLGAIPWLRWLVISLSLQRPGFTPGSVYMGFEVDKQHWDRFFSKFFSFLVSVSFYRG